MNALLKLLLMAATLWLTGFLLTRVVRKHWEASKENLEQFSYLALYCVGIGFGCLMVLAAIFST